MLGEKGTNGKMGPVKERVGEVDKSEQNIYGNFVAKSLTLHTNENS